MKLRRIQLEALAGENGADVVRDVELINVERVQPRLEPHPEVERQRKGVA